MKRTIQYTIGHTTGKEMAYYMDGRGMVWITDTIPDDAIWIDDETGEYS